MHISQPWNTDPRNLHLRPLSGSQEDLAALAHIRNETLRPVTLSEDFTEWYGPAIARFYNRDGFDLSSNGWLFTISNEPVAAAVVYPRSLFPERPPGNFDMYVVPTYRRHGLGSRLLAHLEQAASARGHRVLETTIVGEDSGSSGFLSEQGFAIVGQSFRLSRYGLDNLSDFNLPPEYSIRSLADLGGDPDLYRETTNRLGSYDSNYSLLTPEGIAFMASQETWDPQAIFFLLGPAGRIVGVIRSSGIGVIKGELHEIRIEPSLRGFGLGRALMTAALQYLEGIGVHLVELSTSGDQAAAHNLALRAGFSVTRHWLHFLKKL